MVLLERLPHSTEMNPEAPVRTDVKAAPDAAEIAREVAIAVSEVFRDRIRPPQNAGVRLSVKPEPFHGYASEDASRWMAKFERYAGLQGWTEPQQASAIALFLDGPAELWYLQHQLTFGDSAERLRQMFMAKFGVDANRSMAEEQLLCRTQSREESIDSYAYDICARCHKLGKSPRDTVDAFIRGLLPAVRGQVAVMQPTSMEEAERIARTAIAYSNPTTASVTAVTMDKTALDTFTETLSSLVEAIQPERHPQGDRGQYQARGRGTFRGRGYRRGGRGGRGGNSGVSSSSTIECHRCSQLGHIARNCLTPVSELPTPHSEN